MAKKLTYFDVSGLADGIRFILHHNNVQFEDVRIIDQEKWPEFKESLPFGQVPIYQEGDKVINQSIAICRYVGQQAGLVPSDPWAQAELDAIVLTISDFGLKLGPYYKEKDPVKREIVKKELMEQSVPFFFSRFEKILEKGNGHFGVKLSWADFYFVGFMGTVNALLGKELDEDYPKIHALVKEIRGLPRVKELYERTKDKTIEVYKKLTQS